MDSKLMQIMATSWNRFSYAMWTTMEKVFVADLKNAYVLEWISIETTNAPMLPGMVAWTVEDEESGIHLNQSVQTIVHISTFS